MKVLILKTDGTQDILEADGWEFSQNKYQDYDAVLCLLKDEVVEEEQEIVKEDKVKPSKSGVIFAAGGLSTPLEHVIGKENLEEKRKKDKIVFVMDGKAFTNFSVKKLVTEKYNIEEKGNLDKAVKELIDKEKELSLNYQIKISKEPIVKFETNVFYIEEEISIGKEEA